MTGRMFDFILIGPAKIDGQREPAGKTVAVSHTLALQLADSGLIDPAAAKALSDAIGDTPLSSDFEAAVSAELEKRLSEERKEIEQRVRAEIGDDYAAALAGQAEAEAREQAAQADIAKLTESLSAEVNASADLQKQLAEAEKLISEMAPALEELRKGKVELEATLAELTARKPEKKPTAAKT